MIKKILTLSSLLFILCMIFAASTLPDMQDYVNSPGAERWWRVVPREAGKVAIVTQGDERVACFTLNEGMETAYFSGLRGVVTAAEAECSIELTVYGKGKLTVGVVPYYGHDEEPGTPGAISAGNPIELASGDESPMNISLSFTFNGDTLKGARPQLKLEGKGAWAKFKRFEFKLIGGQRSFFRFRPDLYLTAAGSPVAVNLLFPADVPIFAEKIIIDAADAGAPAKISGREHFTLRGYDASGEVPVGAETDGLRFINGSYDSIYKDRAYVDIYEPGAFEAILAAAEKATVNRKENEILIIGDSISDLYRDYNYVAKLQSAFDMVSPGKIHIHNYGIGGDDIKRAYNRFTGDEKTIHFERYGGIHDVKPDTVIIFMGHNDSRYNDLRRDLSTRLSLEEFENNYKKFIDELRERAKPKEPRVIILTLLPMIYDAQSRMAAELGFFSPLGDPSVVNKFYDATLRIAAESGAEVVDIHKAFQEHGNPGSFYQEDGVHMMNPGSRVIFETVLEYLAQNPL